MTEKMIDLKPCGSEEAGLIDLILMVEDEQDHAELVIDALREVGGVKKVALIENGKTALLVEPGNPTALASALATIAEDPALAREMGRRAANLANDVYSWDSIAALSLNAYDEASRSDDRGART